MARKKNPTVINKEEALIDIKTLELTENGKKAMEREKTPEELEILKAHKEAAEKEESETPKENPKETVKEKSVPTIARIKATLTVPTSVFGKKSIEGKASLMRANTELIMTKLSDIGPTGTNIVSLRKEGSKRIFYTPMENLTVQGIPIN